MSPASGIAALGVAFTAGLTLTLVVVDSSGSGGGEPQRVETAAAPSATETSSTIQIDPSFNLNDDPALVVVADVGDASLDRTITRDGGDTIGAGHQPAR